MRIRSVISFAVLLFLATAAPVMTQAKGAQSGAGTGDGMELMLNYALAHVYGSNFPAGFLAAVSKDMGKVDGVAEFGFHHKSFGSGFSQSIMTAQIGARCKFDKGKKFIPYGQLLVGVDHFAFGCGGTSCGGGNIWGVAPAAVLLAFEWGPGGGGQFWRWSAGVVLDLKKK